MSTTAKKPRDPELHAINTIMRLVNNLPEDSRARVLDYVSDRTGASLNGK